ncbi:MAG TPA: hypothetical protein VGW36_09905 [Pyrinomonadaceae bacterium]|nr:hypothetical protein [Pyrinomonadaceae bacterium]
MTRVMLLVLALSLEASCWKRPGSQTSEPPKNESVATSEASPRRSEEVSKTAERNEEPPLEFTDIDFRNFSYATSLRGKIRLKKGTVEYADPPGGGGDTFSFDRVYYLDLNGDGKKEAIVDLSQVSCGASCDGGAHLFYFYSATQDLPKLFWKVETGDLAYGCGLRSLVVSERQLILETFKSCVFKNGVVEEAYDRNEISGGKFNAASFTRFKFEFSGKVFDLKSREVFPNPNVDVKNYPSRIEVGG